MLKIIKNKAQHLCAASRCRNNRSGKDRLCSKHRTVMRKHADIVRYTYDKLKSNAKRRGKMFTISISYFRQFCEDTNYIELKGRTALKMSIDRQDVTKGYEEGNLQIMSVGDNSAKYHNYERNNF